MLMNKTSYWIRREHLFSRDEYECAACGARSDSPLRICPRCGLPMKGGKDDHGWIDEIEELDAILDD